MNMETLYKNFNKFLKFLHILLKIVSIFKLNFFLKI